MKLHFLGTGAADWDIRLADASVNFRRNSSLLVNGSLLIDPGACLFEFEKTFGYENLYGSVKDVICTHRHPDHFNSDTLAHLEASGAVFHELKVGDTFENTRWLIRAYAANHRTAKDPVHFVVEDKADGKRFFYGCDGAWMFYETYRSLMALGRLELMIFDCTIGDIHGDYRIFEHNNVTMAAEMKEAFSAICPRFLASHLARTLHPAHEQAAAVLASHGIETAYDNWITEV